MICAQRIKGKLISSVVLNDVFSHMLAALQRLQECPERERLEFALMEMVDRLDYLQELYRRNQSLDLLEQEIKRLGLRVQQMQLRFRVHLRVHECL